MRTSSSQRTSLGRSKRGSKRNDDNLLPSISTTLYRRSSSEIVKPSIKLDFDRWTYSYTPKMQQYWDSLYLPLLEEQTGSKQGDPVLAVPSGSGGRRSMTGTANLKSMAMTNKRKSKRKQTKRRRLRTGSAPAKPIMQATNKKPFPYLLSSICKSQRFGMFNIQCSKDESSGKESDILTFYFTISFQPNYRNTYLLRLKYLCDEVVSNKPSSSGRSMEDIFLSHNEQHRTRKVQITCDWDYAAINRIINGDDQDNSPVTPRRSRLRSDDAMGLPADILVNVFEFVKPSKWLALYSCTTKQTDLEVVDKVDKKHFNVSNIGWISNYFGLRSSYLVHLLSVLINFLDHAEVIGFIEKEKQYNRKWDELREAQAELNTMYWSDSD